MPRIDPLPQDEWSEEIGRILGASLPNFDTTLGENNIFSTMARHPELFKAWVPFGGRLLGAGLLPAEDRELLVLRTAVNCGSSYEWGQHVRLSLALDMSRETIDRVPAGAGAEGWSDHEALLLRAADELHEGSNLSDATWAALAEHYDERELIEVVMLVGHYHLVAFALNALDVELDEGLEPLPGS